MAGLNDWMNDPRFGRRFAELFNKSSAFRNIVNSLSKNAFGQNSNMVKVEVDPKTGGPRFAVTKGSETKYFTDIKRASAYASDPLRTVNVFTGRQTGTRTLQPGVSGYYNDFFEGLAESGGGRVIHETYHLNEKNSYHYLLDQLGHKRGRGMRGLIVPDNDIAHVFKFVKNGSSKPMHSDAFLKMLKQNLGMDIQADSSAVFKRLKTLTSMRAYGIFDPSGSTNLRVGLFNPVDIVKGSPSDSAFLSFTDSVRKQAAANPALYGAKTTQEALENIYAKAVDGQMIMPQSGLNQYIDQLKGRLNHFRDIARTMSGNELREINNRIAGTETSISKLLEVQSKGGSFNARFISSAMHKGDVNVISDSSYLNLSQRLGMDISNGISGLPTVLAASTDRKMELTMGSASLQTLELRTKAERLSIGITESATFPQFISRALVDDSFARETEDFLGELTRPVGRGGTLGKMVADVLNTPADVFDSAAEFEEFAQMQRYARQMQNLMDYNIAPGTVDVASRQFMSMYEKHVLKFRRGQFNNYTSSELPDLAYNTMVRGGYRAEISSVESLLPGANLKRQRGIDLMRRTVMYDKGTGRFGFTGQDFYEIYRAGGGPDSDDTYRAIMMYDTESKRLMANLSRQPFEMGEYAFMDVDIDTMPGIPDEIRNLNRQRKAIIKQARHTKLNDRTARPIIERLNEVNEQIDRLMKASFTNVDLASEFSAGKEFMAPKGFAVTDKSRRAYRRASIGRSFHTFNPNDPQAFIRSLVFEDRARDTQFDSLFRFRGLNYNSFDSRYFQYVAKDEQERLAMLAADKSLDPGRVISQTDYMASKGIASQKLAYGSDLVENAVLRMQLTDEANAVLGNYVNVKTVMDNFIETQLRNSGASGLAIPIIDRERIIDAAVKEGDRGVLQAANAITEDMVKTLTNWMVKQHKAGAGFTLDKYMVDTRMKNYIPLMEEALEGSGVSMANLVSEGDMSQRIAQRISDLEDFKATATDIAKGISVGSTDLAGFAPSAEEYQRAKEFVDSFARAKEEIAQKSTLESKIGTIQSALESTGEFDEYFGEEELNRRSMNLLQQQGLLDESFNATRALPRQMLATAKYIEQNAEELQDVFRSGAYSPLTTTSMYGGTSVSDLFYTSLNRYKYRDDITSFNGNIDKWSMMTGPEADELLPGLEAQYRDLQRAFPTLRQGNFDYVDRNQLLPISEAPQGYAKAATQVVADAAAQEVTSKTLRRFDRSVWREMTSGINGLRGAVFAAGVFAGIGLLHGLRDRSPEDMAGPPLLPGGSAYEEYSDVQDYSSIYSSMNNRQLSPGVLYQVNVNGNTDPYALQNNIQSITGGTMNTTIYNSRATTRSGHRNSQSILNDMLGT